MAILVSAHVLSSCKDGWSLLPMNSMNFPIKFASITACIGGFSSIDSNFLRPITPKYSFFKEEALIFSSKKEKSSSVNFFCRQDSMNSLRSGVELMGNSSGFERFLRKKSSRFDLRISLVNSSRFLASSVTSAIEGLESGYEKNGLFANIFRKEVKDIFRGNFDNFAKNRFFLFYSN